jgi:hypothetical protein
MADDAMTNDLLARGGNAPGTENPVNAPADIGTTRQGAELQPETESGRGHGSGSLGDPQITGQPAGLGTGNVTSATDADKDGPRTGPGS